MDHGDYGYYFISILTQGKKDNTYKFALARFLIDYAHMLDDLYLKNRVETGKEEVIDLKTISKVFLKYYWHQVCKFKIRQNFNVNKLPLIVQIIQGIFGRAYIPKPFELMDKRKVAKAEEEIAKKCFAEVIPRFQNISDGIHVNQKKIFYDYDNKSILVRPEALKFFNDNYSLLYKAVILEWAKFLENINRGLPMLISKIEKDESRRTSLDGSYKILRNYFDRCFYCNDPLPSFRKMVHVDHFIPWSYLFEDELWNLVLACGQCNVRKNKSLYPTDFISKIINRNTEYRDKIDGLNKSLLRLEPEGKWQIAINRHYQNCKEFGFTVVNRNIPNVIK